MAEVMLARERLSRDGRQPTDSIESGRVRAKDVFDAQSLWSEVSKNYKNSGRVDSDAAYIATYIDTFARWGAGARGCGDGGCSGSKKWKGKGNCKSRNETE